MNIRTKLILSVGVLAGMIILLVALSVVNLQILTATEPDSPAAVPGLQRALLWISVIGGVCIFASDGQLDKSRKDKCTIAAVLYEVDSNDDTLNGDNIYNSPKIVAKAMLNSEGQAEYTPFSLKLEYIKEYDVTKKYKFAVIFSASEDGAKYNAAIGSKLYIDDVEIINE